MLIVITNQESPNTDIFWQMLSDRDNEKNFIKLCKNLQTSQHLQHFFFYIKKVSAQARRNDQQELKTIKHTHSQTNRNTLEIQHNQFGCLFFVLLSGKNGGKSTIISMALLLLPFNFTSYNIFLQTVIQVILYWFIYNKWWGNSWKQLDNTFFFQKVHALIKTSTNFQWKQVRSSWLHASLRNQWTPLHRKICKGCCNLNNVTMHCKTGSVMKPCDKMKRPPWHRNRKNLPAIIIYNLLMFYISEWEEFTLNFRRIKVIKIFYLILFTTSLHLGVMYVLLYYCNITYTYVLYISILKSAAAKRCFCLWVSVNRG